MSYGLSVHTTEGYVDVDSLRAARLFKSLQLTSTSGNVTVSGFNSTDGFIFVRSNNSDLAGTWSWNNSTKNLSWVATPFTSAPSSNMTAFFMVTT